MSDYNPSAFSYLLEVHRRDDELFVCSINGARTAQIFEMANTDPEIRVLNSQFEVGDVYHFMQVGHGESISGRFSKAAISGDRFDLYTIDSFRERTLMALVESLFQRMEAQH